MHLCATLWRWHIVKMLDHVFEKTRFNQKGMLSHLRRRPFFGFTLQTPYSFTEHIDCLLEAEMNIAQVPYQGITVRGRYKAYFHNGSSCLASPPTLPVRERVMRVEGEFHSFPCKTSASFAKKEGDDARKVKVSGSV